MKKLPSTVAQDGNIFVVIFLAIFLIGLLTAAINSFSTQQESISREDLKIQAAQIIRYGAELENGAQYVLRNGISENDIRFAHADAAVDYGTIATTPTAQVFSQSGGRATYRTASTKILSSGTGNWEFYGTTRVPRVGSDNPELIAVLPNVTQAFCTEVNKNLGLTNIPEDSTTGTSPDCIEGGASFRFGPSAGFNAVPNILDSGTFDKLPMQSACVKCGTDYHYYHVLMSR